MNPERHLSHGGRVEAAAAELGVAVDDIVDFSASLNPLGPPDCVNAAYQAAAADWERYPDPAAADLGAAAGAALGVAPERLVFAAGEDELILAAVRRLAAGELLVPEPAYSSYRQAGELAGLAVRPLRLDAGRNFAVDPDALRAGLGALPPGAGVVLGSPNNPDGSLVDPGLILDCCRRFPGLAFLLDEAFVELCDDPAAASPLGRGGALPDNLVLLRSLTKSHAVPGLRLGYAVAAPAAAARLRSGLQSWPLNCASLRVGRALFAESGDYLARGRALVGAERRRLSAGLAGLGWRVFPGAANFLLAMPPGNAAAEFAARARRRGVLLRSCADFSGLDARYLRLAVRGAADNDLLLDLAREFALEGSAGDAGAASAGCAAVETGFAAADAAASPSPASTAPQRRPVGKRGSAKLPPALMIQGCSSSAGKSLIAAAFCRIFSQDGWGVLPYKAQNMSLNARLTPDGGEIGVAQYIQAQAAGALPDVRMNPVLLKPHSDTGAKLIVLGRPAGDAGALDYGDRAEELSRMAYAAYDELAAGAELMVLEGAGSPAEINLRRRDFVNMRAARHSGARVLLVGDIDRGGVFASFIGHAATFSPAERRLLAGFVVNKFRGEPALLGDAYRQTEAYTGKPVLGTVPWIRSLGIDDEDGARSLSPRPGAPLRVAVLRLPHIANAQDFDPLAAEDDIGVEFVDRIERLAAVDWDCVVLPGSRASAADLGAIRRAGMADLIAARAAAGRPVLGVCGGLQMLGRAILDPRGIESAVAETAGLGLLDLVTEFHADKVQSRSRARHPASGVELDGYEIRHGRSRAVSGETAADMVRADGETIGWRRGAVWASYLHGLFESDGLRNHFANGLRRARGLPERPPTRWPGVEAELDRLADAVRHGCDLPRIYRELGLG